MVDRSAGTASIRIKPDATAFVSDLQAKLRTVRDPGFAINVSADFGQATADVQRWKQQQQRTGVQLGVDVALGQAQADMAAFRARQRADGLVVKVDADTGKASRDVDGLAKQLDSLRPRTLLRLNLGLAGVAALGPAATGLAQVAAAIQQVAQAGLVLPGVMAGAASSIGTLVLGLSGIKDAYDAVSSAAESSGTDQASSARAATAASTALRNAVVDEARAQRDVGRATADRRRELRDLVLEQRGGMLDESRAILEAQKAREDLMSGNFSDVRDATLRVAEADQRVLEVRARNTDSAAKLREENAKGVTGSDAVVNANESLVRSQQQVAQAQDAVAESSTKTSAAQSKALQAMENLSPAAQEVVRMLVDMKPAFADVRTAVSQPLLEGKADEFREFFTTVSPTITKGLSGIARGWNQNITALFDSVSSEEGRGLIDRILGNTGDAQGKLSKAIDPLVKGLGTLTAAGTDALPRLADGLAAISERFAAFITEADEDGRLETWINDGIDGVASLGESVLNIGKTFTAITEAAGGGGSFLRWLENITGRLQTFLNSTEGQNQLKQFFADGKAVFEQWRPVLEDIPGLLRGIHEGAVLYIGGVIQVISPLTEILKEHPGLVGFAIAAYAGFSTIKGITDLTGSLKNITDMLGVGMPGAAGKGAKGITAALAGITAPTWLLALLATGSAAAVGNGVRQKVEEGANLPEGRAPRLDSNGNRIPNSDESKYAGGGGSFDNITPSQWAQQAPNADEKKRRLEYNKKNIKYEDLFKPFTPPVEGSYRAGGPTPGGRGSGPTGGHIIETHGDEWVLPERTRKAIGDERLRAWTRGSFEPGGPTDDIFSPENTNPALNNPPAPIAPNPYQGGGVASIANKAVAGAQNSFNTLSALGQSTPGGTDVVDPVLGLPVTHGANPIAPGPLPVPAVATADPVQGFFSNLAGNLIPGLNFGSSADSGKSGPTPGLMGLFQAGDDPLKQKGWLAQTGDWLADWGAKNLLSFGQTLLSGALGFVGAEGLMSSPVLQGIGKTVGHFGKLSGSSDSDSSSGALDMDSITAAAEAQGITLTPETMDALYAGLGPDSGISFGDLSPAAQRAIGYAQQHAVGQKYDYGGAGQNGRGYDCSGIASGIYSAATGRNVRFTTESDFEALGFQPGVQTGALNIGVMRGGGGPNSHMVVTLPNGVNVESGGAHGTTAYGGPAKGASAMPLQWHLPLPPGFFDGGPTPAFRGGVDGKGGHFAVVHPKEFMISARGRATVPDEFLHALNQGMIDPKDLPGFYPGGPVNIAQGVVVPPPRPNFDAGAGARQRVAAPRPAPSTPRPAAPPAPAPAAAPPIAQQAPPSAPPPPAATPTAPTAIAPTQGSGGTNHTLPWVSTAIKSGAAAIGNAAATAASIGMGGMGGGGAGAMIQGGVMQAGKIVEGIANVVSSAMVGSVPGSFGDPNMPAYGRVNRPEQNRPVTAEYRGSSTTTNHFNGYSAREVLQMQHNEEALQRQARLASVPH